ncbi:MAG: hypothetical protein EX271_00420 [Acidimicrobiales bacterium]|nr:lysozyme [Hyphomonadaceae bacterium]RZV44956.1 MAG: hypothetical protein EX271_00420 [Acidimicrobiales bacterium]
MAHAFKLSDFGLKLIKAYEGFRPVETTLVSGQRVIGFGHRYSPEEEPVISREKAELLLSADLEPYEAMINESVYAPLSQSQFDALVSLSYNIGPKAFLSSNVLHAMNNGRPLDAAAAFDEWRKSIIDGNTYVIDALVRRRTAEKALFLRPIEGVVAAPRNEIPPSRDQIISESEEQMPVYGRYAEEGIVGRAPYEAQTKEDIDFSPTQNRRREDGPAGTLTLSEIVDDDQDEEAQDVPEALPENVDGLSPIAVAAAAVSERLEALIADRPETVNQDLEDSAPDTRVEELKTEKVAIVDDATGQFPVSEPDLPIAANEGTHHEYKRSTRDYQADIRTPDVYISKTTVNGVDQEFGGSGGFWAALLIGVSLFGGGVFKWFIGPVSGLDPVSAFLAPVATIVGAMVVLGATYYLIKSFFTTH